MVARVRSQRAAVMASVERRLTQLGPSPTQLELREAGEDLAKLRYFERFLDEAGAEGRAADEGHP